MDQIKICGEGESYTVIDPEFFDDIPQSVAIELYRQTTVAQALASASLQGGISRAADPVSTAEDVGAYSRGLEKLSKIVLKGEERIGEAVNTTMTLRERWWLSHIARRTERGKVEWHETALESSYRCHYGASMYRVGRDPGRFYLVVMDLRAPRVRDELSIQDTRSQRDRELNLTSQKIRHERRDLEVIRRLFTAAEACHKTREEAA